MIERKKKRTARVGFFAVAHGAYWDQFEGFKENLIKYHADLKAVIEKQEVDIFDYGIIDNNEKAYLIVKKMLADSLDLVFCNMITYASSSVFAPIIMQVNVPLVLVALQPLEALNYDKASTFMQLENDNICSVPEFICAANRLGKKIPDCIIGKLYDDGAALTEIAEWCDIAKVLHDMKGARFGLMGHVLEAMYDMHADPTALSAAFNIHIPLLEIDDIIRFYDKVTEKEIARNIEIIHQEFNMPEPKSDPITLKLSDSDLRQAAKTTAALESFVDYYNLDGLAYYYEGLPDSMHRFIASSLIVGNSILYAKGFPMCGEYDIKTCIAMFIMDRLDIGGSFAEFHPFDFNGNYILVGHDGPHHIKIAEGKPKLRSLIKYHGKPGSGASVEFNIKEGPITMLGLTQTVNGKLKFVIGEGFSQHGPTPPTGNTNTRAFFGQDVKKYIKNWVMEGPTHHYALGIGHKANTIKKIADVFNIESVIVKE